MREMTGPSMDPLPDHAHLLEPVVRWATETPDRVIASYRAGDAFPPVTAATFLGRVRAIAKGLLAAGVERGDRVVIMSHTRLEWLLTDYAILAVGAVTVPIYETSSAEQVDWILRDSESVLAVVETPEMQAMVAEAMRTSAPKCREALVLDDGDLDRLVERGAAVEDATLDERIDAMRIEDLASIVYTSGTTGRPKGCVLTHRNLRTNVQQSLDAMRSMLGDDEVILLFLPLAHVLTKTIALVAMEWGATLAFATGLDKLAEELAMVQPTLVIAVPRVFEKVYNGAHHKAVEEGHGKIFDVAESVAIRWSEDHAAGRHRPFTNAEHALFDRLVYKKLQHGFGGRLRFAVSGGGPLGDRLTHFFNGAGIRIFEGYGLTETSPTLTINRDGAWRPGTVGRPLGGTSIRIADDGEILTRGPQVFSGYWRADAATAAVLDADGWFATGDIGELDDDGFLRITGRKKELIVTAAGKNVAPAPLEDRLRAHPLISQAIVVGDQRPFVAAMLAFDEDAVRQWASDHGKGDMELTELATDVDLLAELQLAVDDANRSVSRAESIRTFAVLAHDLTIAAGELTPTLKVRREVVAKTYDAVIDGIYS